MTRQTIRFTSHDPIPGTANPSRSVGRGIEAAVGRFVKAFSGDTAPARHGRCDGTKDRSRDDDHRHGSGLTGRLIAALGRAVPTGPDPVTLPVPAPARCRRLRLSSFAGDRQGAAAIEVAAVMPILVIVGLGTFEFGHIFYSTQLIQTGLRDAARYIARAPDPATAEATARQLATTGTVDGSGAPRVSWWQTDEIQITYETTANLPDATTGLRAYRAGDQLQVVRVSTAIDYQGLGFLNSTIGPIRIAAAHEERYVGQ